MSGFTWLVQTGLGFAQAVATIVATVLTIAVAFLARPGRPTLLWSCAFVLAMTAMFGILSGELNDIELWRRVSLAALLGAPPLLWSGFRAWWGQRALPWIGPVVAAVAAVAFVLAPDPSTFLLAYRLAFAASGVFAGLVFLGWLRVRSRRDPYTIVFAGISLAFSVIALASATLAFLPQSQEAVDALRVSSAVGMLVYTASAIVAILGVTLRGTRFMDRSPAVSEEWERFASAAAARLRGGLGTGEPWSVLYFRLDDAEEVRRAAGSALVSTLETRFEDAVRDAVGEDAELGSPDRGTVVAVVVARSDADVREVLRSALTGVASIDPERRAPIRPSASAGWAPASAVGYDFVALVYLAREAAELAGQRGGDRWERVNATVGQMLVSRSAQL